MNNIDELEDNIRNQKGDWLIDLEILADIARNCDPA